MMEDWIEWTRLVEDPPFWLMAALAAIVGGSVSQLEAVGKRLKAYAAERDRTAHRNLNEGVPTSDEEPPEEPKNVPIEPA